jgi:hypothetical protein
VRSRFFIAWIIGIAYKSVHDISNLGNDIPELAYIWKASFSRKFQTNSSISVAAQR